jgi:hypothetical protein
MECQPLPSATSKPKRRRRVSFVPVELYFLDPDLQVLRRKAGHVKQLMNERVCLKGEILDLNRERKL